MRLPAALLTLVALIFAHPVDALDIRSTATTGKSASPGNPLCSNPQDVEFNRADKTLTLCGTDGQPSVTTLLKALPAGRKAVEQGKGDDLTVTSAPTGSVARALTDRLLDLGIHVKDFGAKCDGTTNDTVAFANAISAVIALGGGTLRVPGGVCLVDQIVYAPASNKAMRLVGAGKSVSVIRKRTATLNNLLTVGQNPSPFVLNDIHVESLTLDGLERTSTYAAIEGLDVWRMTLRDVSVINAQIGFECLSCIYVNFEASTAILNKVGLRFNKYSGSHYGATPNLIQIQNSQIFENTVLGVDYDSGVLLTLRGTNVEYNGSMIGAIGQGGIIVGANVGTNNRGTVGLGLLLEDVWFEGNKGEADVVQTSGRGSYRNIFMWQVAGQTTYDFKFNGGNYTIDNAVVSTIKTPNVFEGPGVLAGNAIRQSTFPGTLAVDPAKTAVVFAPSDGLQSGYNRIINGNFALNQRGYVSGGAIAAGVYMHDRWKAGGSGATYTFSQAVPDTSVTITAGSLRQDVSASSIDGATMTLTWVGTAQARVYQGSPAGSYGRSPLTVALTPGQTTSIEFGAGTVGQVQMVSGKAIAAFQRRSYAEELRLAQRFYATGYFHILCAAYAANARCADRIRFPGTMRAAPKVGVFQISATAMGAPLSAAVTVDGVTVYGIATGANTSAELYGTWVADSEL